MADKNVIFYKLSDMLRHKKRYSSVTNDCTFLDKIAHRVALYNLDFTSDSPIRRPSIRCLKSELRTS